MQHRQVLYRPLTVYSDSRSRLLDLLRHNRMI